MKMINEMMDMKGNLIERNENAKSDNGYEYGCLF